MAAEDQDKLADEWAAALDEQGGGEAGSEEELADDWAAAMAEQEGGGSEGGSEEALADEWAAALSETGVESTGQAGPQPSDSGLADEWASALADQEQDGLKKEKEQEYFRTQTRPHELKDLTQEAKSPRVDGTKRDLDFILDIPLDVSAELGRTKLLINELLQLGQGSVVELNKLAGEPLEIYVNGKLVARGEAVVINEKFGIRLTDIISPIERVKQLA